MLRRVPRLHRRPRAPRTRRGDHRRRHRRAGAGRIRTQSGRRCMAAPAPSITEQKVCRMMCSPPLSLSPALRCARESHLRSCSSFLKPSSRHSTRGPRRCCSCFSNLARARVIGTRLDLPPFGTLTFPRQTLPPRSRGLARLLARRASRSSWMIQTLRIRKRPRRRGYTGSFSVFSRAAWVSSRVGSFHPARSRDSTIGRGRPTEDRALPSGDTATSSNCTRSMSNRSSNSRRKLNSSGLWKAISLRRPSWLARIRSLERLRRRRDLAKRDGAGPTQTMKE